MLFLYYFAVIKHSDRLAVEKVACVHSLASTSHLKRDAVLQVMGVILHNKAVLLASTLIICLSAGHILYRRWKRVMLSLGRCYKERTFALKGTLARTILTAKCPIPSSY